MKKFIITTLILSLGYLLYKIGLELPPQEFNVILNYLLAIFMTILVCYIVFHIRNKHFSFVRFVPLAVNTPTEHVGCIIRVDKNKMSYSQIMLERPVIMRDYIVERDIINGIVMVTFTVRRENGSLSREFFTVDEKLIGSTEFKLVSKEL